MIAKNYNEAVNDYFKLKEQYEIGQEAVKNSFLKTNQDLSWREKRNLFKSLNFKCINCARYVGSIFKTNVKNKDNRHLVARCGDKTNPCPFNIDINLGITVTYQLGLEINSEMVSDIKIKIIRRKNNLLFGYISSKYAIDNWDKLKDEYASAVDIYEYTNQALLHVTNNVKKKEKIAELQQLIYQQSDNIKLFIQQFKETNNGVLIDDAIKIYVNDLLVNIKELDMLCFAYKSVEYDSTENNYHLIEKQYSVEDMEYNIGDTSDNPNDNVGSFVTGLRKETANTTTATANTTATTLLTDIVKKKGRKTKAELAKEEEELDKLPDKFGPGPGTKALAKAKTVKTKTVKAGLDKTGLDKTGLDKTILKKTDKTKTVKRNPALKKVVFEILEEEPVADVVADVEEEKEEGEGEGKGYEELNSFLLSKKREDAGEPIKIIP